MPFGLWVRMGPRNHVLDGVQIPPSHGQFFGKRAPIVQYRDFLPWAAQKRQVSASSVVFARWRQCARRHSAVSCAKRLNRSICRLIVDSGGPKKHKFNRIRHVVPMWSHGRAHWRHLANTIQSSVCSGYAALCQITLITYFTCAGHKQTNKRRWKVAEVTIVI